MYRYIGSAFKRCDRIADIGTSAYRQLSWIMYLNNVSVYRFGVLDMWPHCWYRHIGISAVKLDSELKQYIGISVRHFRNVSALPISAHRHNVYRHIGSYVGQWLKQYIGISARHFRDVTALPTSAYRQLSWTVKLNNISVYRFGISTIWRHCRHRHIGS